MLKLVHTIVTFSLLLTQRPVPPAEGAALSLSLDSSTPLIASCQPPDGAYDGRQQQQQQQQQQQKQKQ